MKLIDLDAKIIITVTDETKGGMMYEEQMTLAEFFSKCVPDYQPEIVDAVPVEWLQNKMNEADDKGDWRDYGAIDWLLMMWRTEQEAI